MLTAAAIAACVRGDSCDFGQCTDALADASVSDALTASDAVQPSPSGAEGGAPRDAGDVETGADDGGADGDAGEAGTPPLGFCASSSGHLGCWDFDSVASPTSGWTSSVVAPASALLAFESDGSPPSAPNALRIAVPSVASPTTAEARLDFTTSPAPLVLVVEASIFIPDGYVASTSTIRFAAYKPNVKECGGTFSASSSLLGSPLAQHFSAFSSAFDNTASTPKVIAPRNAWSIVFMRLTRTAAGSTVEARVNGVDLGTVSVSGGCLEATHAALSIGFPKSQYPTGSVLSFDNVRFRTGP